ncbi:MAG TPA: peptidoglycan DD-metalloendopeptidase family protein [Nodosilinea sp.]|nr:peptidoglycan DD-metalloendopeptidase family protein [Nodosilinea sp.]
MLGIALSFGASAPLLTEPELALAAEGSVLTVLPASSRGEAQALKFVPSQASTSASYHTVEAGESLWKIATKHQSDVQSIKAANGIASDEVLKVGQVIRVPAVGLEGLATEADASRLALGSKATGGVGGDSTTARDLTSTTLPLVSELESIPSLEDPLALAEADQEAQLNGLSLPLDISAAETLAQQIGEPIATLPLAVEADEAEASAALEPTSGWFASAAAPAEMPTQAVEEPVALSPEEPVVDQTLPLSAPLNPESAALPTASQAVGATKKDLAIAILPSRPVDAGSAVVVPEAAGARAYQIKPGDTLWSIASRNGVTLDELLSHNRSVSRPEALAVGDSITIPQVASAQVGAQEADQPAVVATTSVITPRTRDQVIRDHLARIRESNSALVDREELNARIREARQELERSRGIAIAPPSASTSYRDEAVSLASAAVGEGEPATADPLVAKEGSQAADLDWTVTDVATQVPQPVAAQEPQQVAVLTPEVDDSLAEEPVQLNENAAQSTLLAAAPLGAGAYRATPSLPVGQTVSPSMPMLPAASEFLPEAPALSNGYVWPTRGTLTSGYGWRWGRMHRGVDIAGPVGTPIVAAASGVVVRSGWNSGGYGNLVDVRHPDGSMTRYAHNSRLLVRQGEQVRQGQQIAEMGSTGYSTGPHLHFEVHLPSSGTVNPMAYLPGR